MKQKRRGIATMAGLFLCIGLIFLLNTANHTEAMKISAKKTEYILREQFDLLISAIEENDETKVDELLDRAKENGKIKSVLVALDEYGYSPFTWAIFTDNSKLLRKLIDVAEAEQSDIIEAVLFSPTGYLSDFKFAVSTNNKEAVEILFDVIKKKRPEIIRRLPLLREGGFSLLEIAVKGGDSDIIGLLAEPISMYPKVIDKILLRSKQSIGVALLMAVEDEDCDVIRILLRVVTPDMIRQLPIDALKRSLMRRDSVKNWNGWTLLAYAIAGERYDVAKTILNIMESFDDDTILRAIVAHGFENEGKIGTFLSTIQNSGEALWRNEKGEQIHKWKEIILRVWKLSPKVFLNYLNEFRYDEALQLLRMRSTDVVKEKYLKENSLPNLGILDGDTALHVVARSICIYFSYVMTGQINNIENFDSLKKLVRILIRKWKGSVSNEVTEEKAKGILSDFVFANRKSHPELRYYLEELLNNLRGNR